MKLAFLILVLVNLLLYAWQQGVFGRYGEGGREPERVARQIEPERIRVLTEGEVQKLRERASQSSAPLDLTVAQSCIEFGDFGPGEAARAEQALAALTPSVTPVPRAIEAPGWYVVYLPSQKTRADAERRAEELRKLGLKDILVMGDSGPLKFGISLGSFRDPAVAKAHFAELEKMGVKGVRISEKPSSITVTRYELRDLDAAAVAQLAQLRGDFPAQTLRACPGPS
jgi:hypothetical protein